MSDRTRLTYVPALDGLRGLAVAAVLLFHAELGWARGGFLGVSAFFTLSGFLITSLLLSEHRATGRIDLRAFWARRARRLLPAAYASLAGILVFGVFAADADQLRGLRADVFAALGYVANWRFLLDGRSYADVFGSPSPVQHFWSLAIEEQYYLAFPLLAAAALALGRGRRRVLGWVLAVLTAGSAILAISSSGLDRVYYGTDTRAAELLLGALLAIVTAGRVAPSRRSLVRALDVAGGLALALMLVAWTRTGQDEPWLYDGGFALHAALTCVVIAACTHGSVPAGVLATAPLRALGRISYGAYLYHWPVYLWLDGERTGLDRGPLFALRVAVTFCLATASFFWLEQPIRTGRALTGRLPRIVAPAAAGALVIAVAAVTAAPPPPMIVFAAAGEAPPPMPTDALPFADGTGSDTRSIAAAGARGDSRLGVARPGTGAPGATPPGTATVAARSHATGDRPRTHRSVDNDRPLRLLVVGDSVGLTLGRGLERAAAAGGHAQVWNIARPWCGIGRYAERALGRGVEGGGACDAWPQLWGDAVAGFDPDTVVVLSTIWEIVERRRAGWPDFLAPGDPAYDEWLASEYVAAADVLGALGARVVWLTLPCVGISEESGARIEHVNSRVLRDVARRRPSTVEIVDLFGRVCPGGEFTDTLGGVVDARPDGVHFSDAGADWAAGWLMPLIESRTAGTRR